MKITNIIKGRAFTLIELLIVVAILSIMVAGWSVAMTRSTITGRIIKADAKMTQNTAVLEQALVRDLPKADNIIWDSDTKKFQAGNYTYTFTEKGTVWRQHGEDRNLIAPDGIYEWEVSRTERLIHVEWTATESAGQINRSRSAIVSILARPDAVIDGIPEAIAQDENKGADIP